MSNLEIRNLFFGLLFLAANGIFAYLVIFFEYHHLHDENSLMENVQALLLATGCFCYLLLLAGNTRNVRLINGALSLLCFSFTLRELDIEHLPVPALIRLLGSGHGRTILLLFLWGFLFRFWIVSIPEKKKFVVNFVQTRKFYLLFLALLMLIGSALIDSKTISIPHPRLFEELLEINAYFLIVLPALYRFLIRYRLLRAISITGD